MTSRETYFKTMAAAIETAISGAQKKGYEVIDNTTFLQPVNYLQTERITYELTKEGKPQRKALIVVLYRMDSGIYELTYYIN